MNVHLSSVRHYLSATSFLKDYFAYRLKLEPSFSYELWACELGFKSRTYMRLLCQGQRPLTKSFIESFSAKIGLSVFEKHHLHLMALYESTDDSDIKKVYHAQMLSSFQKDECTLEPSAYADFLSHKQLPLLHLLLSVEGMIGTPENLAHLLKTSSQEIMQHLEILKRLELASFINGVWTSRSRSFKSTGKSEIRAMADFNKATLKECEQVIEEDVAVKRFRSIFFAMNASKITEVDKEIEAFVSFLKNKYSTPEGVGCQYFKMNMQLYPVSQPMTSQVFVPKPVDASA